MSQQQQGIIEDQPLKVLGLFPRRQLNSMEFNQNKFLRLYDSLCCTICRQLFNHPVYLKCSHRFCKQCIEKYIRFTDKKSCPNCRGDLNTKRDLRLDYGVATLINYAFGNRTKFCQGVAQLENAEAINFQLSATKSSTLVTTGIIRAKSFAQEQLKSPKKKVKLFENSPVQQEGQTRGRKKKSKSIQNSKNIEESSRTQQLRLQTNDFTTLNEKLPKTDDKIAPMKIVQNEIDKIQQSKWNKQEVYVQRSEPIQAQRQVKKRRGRKKKIPVVQIKSFSDDELQSVNKSSQLQLPQLIQLQQKMQVIHKQSQIPAIAQRLKQRSAEKPSADIETRFDSFQRQKKCLTEQFGDNYMLKLMQVPILDFLIEFKLQRHPDCLFTPLIPCKSIQVSAKSKVHNIFVLLSKLLNVSITNLKLYVNSQSIQQLPYQQLSKKSICQLNQETWKTATDVQVFDMKEILSSLEDARGQRDKYHNQSRQKYQKKKLFEKIQIDRQQRQVQPRKRGRGRSRKIEQKENFIDGKEDFKRVFYYQLYIQ